ncbi:MAG: translation elongation factor Ts [Clostridiaceae bacterium]|mgnify:FL=1|jgi:elongation factor Ts|nr:translation elongation factor Ts [Clostridiaceae bacterium]
MEISAAMVKDLRDRTGAGMMDCKNALVEAQGDIEKAFEILRERGLSKAAKKSGRLASEGIVDAYIHGGGRIGVLVEVNIETDFAAKNEEFRAFVKDIAMQIAAMNPLYIKREDIPAEVIDREKEILKTQAINEGKPEHIAEKMVNGRIEKYFNEVCLLKQSFIKDNDKTVEDVLKEKIALIGENISIRRFARFEMGEGLEKKNKDFAEEVAKQIK